MYVFGGGWDVSDKGANIDARTIGVSPQWKKFFNRQKSSTIIRPPGIRREMDWIVPALWGGLFTMRLTRRAETAAMSVLLRR